MASHRISLNLPWPWDPNETREMLMYLFQVSLLTYLGFYLLEDVQPGLVSDWLSLDLFLWISLGLGALTALWPAVSGPTVPFVSWKKWLWLSSLSLAAGMVVYTQIVVVDSARLLVAVVSAGVIFITAAFATFDHARSA